MTEQAKFETYIEAVEKPPGKRRNEKLQKGKCIQQKMKGVG